MARGMAMGYGKANFLGYGKKKLGYGSRHTPEAEMTPLVGRGSCLDTCIYKNSRNIWRQSSSDQ